MGKRTRKIRSDWLTLQSLREHLSINHAQHDTRLRQLLAASLDVCIRQTGLSCADEEWQEDLTQDWSTVVPMEFCLFNVDWPASMTLTYTLEGQQEKTDSPLVHYIDYLGRALVTPTDGGEELAALTSVTCKWNQQGSEQIQNELGLWRLNWCQRQYDQPDAPEPSAANMLLDSIGQWTTG